MKIEHFQAIAYIKSVRNIQSFNQVATLLTFMQRTLLTLSGSQLSRAIDEIDDEDAGETSSNSDGKSIRNFQSRKSIGCIEKISF